MIKVPQPPIDRNRSSEDRRAWFGMFLAAVAAGAIALGVVHPRQWALDGIDRTLAEHELVAQVTHRAPSKPTAAVETLAATTKPADEPQAPKKEPDFCPT